MHWTTIVLPPLLSLLTFTTPTTALQETTRIRAKFTPNCPSNDSPSTDLNEEFTAALNIRSGICQGVPVPMPLGYFDEVDHVSVALEILEGAPSLEDESEDSHEDEEDEEQPTPSISWTVSTSHPHSSSTPHYTSTTTFSSTHTTGIEAISWKRHLKRAANLEVCTVQLFERPSCYGSPLIQREFGAGAGIGGESKCVTRSPAYMGLGEVFVKVDCVDGSVPHPVPKGKSHGNETVVGSGVHHGGVHGGSLNATASAIHENRTISARDVAGGKWQRRRMALLGR
ncbi:hypothetical protein BDV06DRAFT_225075 [Aspergillus oleicola]